ncbi:actin [Pseudozyma hubeiensis SY62]|uniref:Actin n=1 Tax=Pseudozyma hubeiensis (strain SY62) TaxID=1305764 RepID=R9P0W4_PSEHS|nr:actin [Pseudozyma hubeiensis SY62]GAC94727.1 actin [Pseudozyma hubeiensis SY62]
MYNGMNGTGVIDAFSMTVHLCMWGRSVLSSEPSVHPPSSVAVRAILVFEYERRSRGRMFKLELNNIDSILPKHTIFGGPHFAPSLGPSVLWIPAHQLVYALSFNTRKQLAVLQFATKPSHIYRRICALTIARSALLLSISKVDESQTRRNLMLVAHLQPLVCRSQSRMTNVPPTSTAAAASVRLPPIHLRSDDDTPTLALPNNPPSSLFHYHLHTHHQHDRYQRQAQHPLPRQSMSASPLPPSFNSRVTSSTQTASSSSSTTGIHALTLAAKQEDEISLSFSDEDMLLCDEADDDENWSDAAPSSVEGAASNAEKRDKRGSAASSVAGKGGAAEGNMNGKRNSNNRSRRLLSLEQSKVLYKILDKVWFQNRRQVGKKRMMESVQSLLSTYPPCSSAQLSLDHIQDQLRSTGKTRFSANEDERTRAWRRHTIRLALNPSAAEEEESKAAIRELERGSSAREYYEMHPGAERDREWGRDAAAAAASRGLGWMEMGERDSRIRASRSAASLRINVPRLRSHSSTSDSHTPATASTPTYTGPGSATHLESISSARTFFPSPLTAPSTRTILTTPTINSQKESFSIPPHNTHVYRPYPRPSLPPPPMHQTFALQSGVRRDRSATLSGGTVQWKDSDLRHVRNDLTAEWRYAQQRLLRHQPVDLRRVSPPSGRYSPYHVEGSRRGRSESTPVDPGERWQEVAIEHVAVRVGSPLNSRRFESVQQTEPNRPTSPNDPTKQDLQDSVGEHTRRNSRMDVRSLTTSNITNTRGSR